MTIKAYVLLSADPEVEAYPVDNEVQREAARVDMLKLGIVALPVWHGDPDDPDSYRDPVRLLWAQDDEDEALPPDPETGM